MLKKLLFSLLCALMVYSTSVAAYRIFEPKQEKLSVDSSSFISYASLKGYIVSSGESSTHFLFFYNELDTDSVYVRTSVLNEVIARTGLDLSGMIETVDLASYNQENLPADMAEQWGLASYPAFAIVTLNDGQITVEEKLEYSSSVPITAPVLIQWLKDVGLYED